MFLFCIKANSPCQPLNKPIWLPHAPDFPPELQVGTLARRMEARDFKTLLKASNLWFNAALNMKTMVEGQVLRNEWYLPRQVRFYVACANLYVSILGLMPPDTPSDITHEEIHRFQPDLCETPFGHFLSLLDSFCRCPRRKLTQSIFCHLV
jgi:hypothetical protein